MTKLSNFILTDEYNFSRHEILVHALDAAKRHGEMIYELVRAVSISDIKIDGKFVYYEIQPYGHLLEFPIEESRPEFWII